MTFGYIFWVFLGALAPSMQDCPGTPTVLFENSNPDANYAAITVANPGCGSSSYWLGTDNASNAGFTLDYGQDYHADGFYLRNDRNFMHNDRATINFKIEYSLDNVLWLTALESSFSTPIPPTHPCEKTMLFAASEPDGSYIHFRYIKFTALTHYGNGAALNYFSPRTVDCNQISVLMDYATYANERAYSAQGVLQETCSKTSTTNIHHHYWRGSQKPIDGSPGRVSGIGFILDLGRKMGIFGFQIMNDNSADNTRGTRDFEILVSDDLSIWTKTVEGTLSDLTSSAECGPTKYFSASGTIMTRYVRFRDKSHYRDGPALAFFEPVTPEMDCRKKELAYASTPTIETSVTNESDCTQLCKDDMTCAGSTYEPSSGSCKTFDKNALFTKMADSLGSVTYIKHCIPGCSVIGDKIPHNDIRGVNDVSIETCLQECKDETGCVGAVWFVRPSHADGLGICWLKSTVNNRVYGGPDTDKVLLFPDCVPTCQFDDAPSVPNASGPEDADTDEDDMMMR